MDLHFVPLRWEDYDFIVPGDALDAATALLTALRQPPLRAAVEALASYDASRSGPTRRSRRHHAWRHQKPENAATRHG